MLSEVEALLPRRLRINQLHGIMGTSPRIVDSTMHVVRCYEKATYSYFTPIAFVLLGFVLDFLLPLALLTALPCSIIGLYFSFKGFKLSNRSGDLEKKDVGYANILLGIILFVTGLLGAGFAYVWISG